jgi:hypothetical protein
MAKKATDKNWKSVKKKTRIGKSVRTKYGRPGPNGGNKRYRKPYKGQGK